jgi:GNAT superfamily N-acetyltransferase
MDAGSLRSGPMPGTRVQVELLATRAAEDAAVVEEIAGVINGAYALSERDLWVEGTVRTTPEDIAEAIRGNGMLLATIEGRIVGCACVRALDESTADLGFVSAAPGHRGRGIGRELVRAAEELVRSRGARTMQLELLVPQGWVHPEKDQLRAWYVRLGYRITRAAPFDEVAVHASSQLATPCEFLVFRKPLGADAAAR